QRVDRGILEPRQAGRDVLVRWPPDLTEARVHRERATVDGKVDGPSQARVGEGTAPCVEEEEVDVRSRTGEELLSAGAGGLTASSVLLLEPPDGGGRDRGVARRAQLHIV